MLFPRVHRLFHRLAGSLADAGILRLPTLAEVFVFENVDPGIWEQVFIHLRDIMLQGFMRHRRPLAPGVLQEMYLGKTRKRLESMHGAGRVAGAGAARRARSRSTAAKFRTFRAVGAAWRREVERLAENVQGCVVHGDMCLSNILYDLRSRICKLLDPRGSFGARRHLRRSALRRGQAVPFDLRPVRLHHQRFVPRVDRRRAGRAWTFARGRSIGRFKSGLKRCSSPSSTAAKSC